MSEEDLRKNLRRIEGRSYGAYKDLRGVYRFRAHQLAIDHVQRDPFAPPSRMRVRISAQEAAWPAEFTASAVRRLALADWLARRVDRAIRQSGRGGHGGKNSGGRIRIDAGGQEVLERSAIRLGRDFIEARLEVGLPAAGRRVLAGEAETLLCESLPQIALSALCFATDVASGARRFVECIENQEHIRAHLCERGLLAFISNGSILPRRSGASQEPLPSREARPFLSPAAFEVEFEIPNPQGDRTSLRGMGIPRGVTLIVGGGYHGKSTLLRALERGVYPHIPGDGREGVVAEAGLVKIRAEDGRRVERVDIQPFIRELPRFAARQDTETGTRHFSSDDASGSTSQAANIVEALEAGATGLLLDEDTCATNFMVRDARMQALIDCDCEPITPFVDRVREIFERFGVSTVLVMGGCGDYFEAADHVISMRDYVADDAGAAAKEVAEKFASLRRNEARAPFEKLTARVPSKQSFDPSLGRRQVRIDARTRDALLYGSEAIDLRAVEQLVDRSQTRAIGYAIHLASERWMADGCTLAAVLDKVETLLDEEGLDSLSPFRGDEHPGALARPRRFEIAAAINRLRSMRIRA